VDQGKIEGAWVVTTAEGLVTTRSIAFSPPHVGSLSVSLLDPSSTVTLWRPDGRNGEGCGSRLGTFSHNASSLC